MPVDEPVAGAVDRLDEGLQRREGAHFAADADDQRLAAVGDDHVRRRDAADLAGEMAGGGKRVVAVVVDHDRRLAPVGDEEGELVEDRRQARRLCRRDGQPGERYAGLCRLFGDEVEGLGREVGVDHPEVPPGQARRRAGDLGRLDFVADVHVGDADHERALVVERGMIAGGRRRLGDADMAGVEAGRAGCGHDHLTVEIATDSRDQADRCRRRPSPRATFNPTPPGKARAVPGLEKPRTVPPTVAAIRSTVAPPNTVIVSKGPIRSFTDCLRYFENRAIRRIIQGAGRLSNRNRGTTDIRDRGGRTSRGSRPSSTVAPPLLASRLASG